VFIAFCNYYLAKEHSKIRLLTIMFSSILLKLALCVSSAASYNTLSTSYVDSNKDIMRVSIHNPPINLVDANLINDLFGFLTDLNSTDTAPKTVIFSSSVKDFFMTHIDFHPVSQQEPVAGNGTAINDKYGEILALLNQLPVIFIGESNGLTLAAGNEFFLHMDMRFAGPDATFGAIEPGIGFFQLRGYKQLSQLIGAGRAAQYLLTCLLADSPTAARIGWINDMFSNVAELEQNSNSLAKRMALFPIGGLAATKKLIIDYIGTAEQQFEDDVFASIQDLNITQDAITRYLALSHNETDAAFEIGKPETLVELWKNQPST
jgi:enoyl-CoA hydratase/carnithine racemase